MPPSNRNYIMTAMMQKTIKALATSMYRLRKTEELLRASKCLLNHPELSEAVDRGTNRNSSGRNAKNRLQNARADGASER